MTEDLPSSSLPARPHHCETCNKSYKNKHTLVEHEKTHTTTHTPPVCYICNITFSTRYTLHRHMNTHSETKPLRCSMCYKGFNSNSQYYEHVRIEHDGVMYKCEQCRAEFNKRSNLNRHLLTHQQIQKFSCGLCSRRFSQKSHLTYHHGVHFKKNKQCPKCGVELTSVKAFNTHLSKVCFSETNHTPSFKCEICVIQFNNKKRLYKHIRASHFTEDKMACPVCEVEFSKTGLFVAHLEQCYSSGETFELCDNEILGEELIQG